MERDDEIRLNYSADPTTNQKPPFGIPTSSPRISSHVTIYRNVAELTRGCGGDYLDECTSGKQPGDEEEGGTPLARLHAACSLSLKGAGPLSAHTHH